MEQFAIGMMEKFITIGTLKYVQTIGLATMDAHMNKLVKMG